MTRPRWTIQSDPNGLDKVWPSHTRRKHVSLAKYLADLLIRITIKSLCLSCKQTHEFLFKISYQISNHDRVLHLEILNGNFGDIFRLGLGGAGEWTETDEI